MHGWQPSKQTGLQETDKLEKQLHSAPFAG